MKRESKNGSPRGKHGCMRGKIASRFCMFPKVKSAASSPAFAPVYLNVYDLTPINGYMYWAGLGIFHTGVEVCGAEYAFGAHDFSASGVFEVEPRQCPGFKFRKAIFMGTTSLEPSKVREFVEQQSTSYYGDTYHLIFKNCNHFCDDICCKLTGKRIPKWVNRLARIGSKCNCILPESIKGSTAPDPHLQVLEDEMKNLRIFSISSFSMPQEEPISSLFLHSHYRECLSPTQAKKDDIYSL